MEGSKNTKNRIVSEKLSIFQSFSPSLIIEDGMTHHDLQKPT